MGLITYFAIKSLIENWMIYPLVLKIIYIACTLFWTTATVHAWVIIVRYFAYCIDEGKHKVYRRKFNIKHYGLESEERL